MDCPVCGEKLKEIERSGVSIDICPSCKGVWLDRGEIDKIIAAESKGAPVAPLTQVGDERVVQERREYGGHDDHDHDYKHGDHGGDYYHGSSGGKRRSSFLSDILGGLGGD